MQKKKQGFTLVEVVIAIAIMAVLLAVLAPSLLKHVENSRVQKDESAMDELCHTVQLAMSDAEIFDEVSSYLVSNNYITYTDSSGVYGAKEIDEEYWAPDGSAKAVTITFNPDSNGAYNIGEALVNDMTYGNGSMADPRVADGLKQCYFKNMGEGKLYTKVKATLGEALPEKSATYKNSSYTIFIEIETIDGMKRATVHGEFNGTNLSEDSMSSLGSGTDSYDANGEAESTKVGGATTTPSFDTSDLTGAGVGTEPPEYVENKEIADMSHPRYYGSVNGAIDDANANTPGAHANATADTAVAALYKKSDGKNVVVLLKNSTTTSTITVTRDVILNLDKYTLTIANTNRGIVISSGKLEVQGHRGTIHLTNDNTPSVVFVSNSNLVIEGGTYKLNNKTGSSSANAIVRVLSGSANISNASFEGSGVSKPIYGIYTDPGTQTNITRCNITTYTNAAADSRCYAIYAKGETNIIGCNVKSSNHAVGGIINIHGGTYYGPATPFFICKTAATSPNTASIRNAYIGYMAPPSGYTYGGGGATVNVVIFGGNAETKDITLTIDNCKIVSGGVKTTAVRMQSAYGERNLTLKISNTTADFTDMSTQLFVNYTEQGHKLYIGQGCNFSKANASHPDSAWETNETY